MKRIQDTFLAMLAAVSAGCTSLDPVPALEYVSYSLHSADGSQGAERSFGADGTIRGSHLTRTRAAPIVSMSTEAARPEDVAEVTALARELYKRMPESATRPDGASFKQLVIKYADGQLRSFRRSDAEKFDDPALRRLQDIIGAYRAGHW